VLLDYIPTDKEMQASTIARKRQEYLDMVKHYFGSEEGGATRSEMSTYEKKAMKQIKIDVFRTIPEMKVFAQPRI